MASPQVFEKKTPIRPLLFGIIVALLTIDYIMEILYLPSLPVISKEFANNYIGTKLTYAFFLLSFSISQLIFGPLSDKIGRRTPVCWGISVGSAGSLLCFLAPSIPILVIGRFIEGIGAGICLSIGRSISRDLLAGNQLSKFLSEITMIGIIVTAVSVVLGGYIQHFFGWRFNFLILTFYTFVILIVIWQKLPETNQYRNLELTLNMTVRNYLSLLKNKKFIGFTLCISCALSGIAANQVFTPFLFQNTLGLTTIEYGWLFFLLISFLLVSAFINSKLVLKHGIVTMLLAGVYLMIAAGLLMLSLSLWGLINIIVIIGPMIIFLFGLCFAILNGLAGAIHLFPTMAGTAGALVGHYKC
jgi:DHA1 family 2-module integral membrane pump EmrD-like MFS transporter